MGTVVIRYREKRCLVPESSVCNTLRAYVAGGDTCMKDNVISELNDRHVSLRKPLSVVIVNVRERGSARLTVFIHLYWTTVGV